MKSLPTFITLLFCYICFPVIAYLLLLNILTSAGTEIIIVADIKYAHVLTSIHTANLQCAHASKPNKTIVLHIQISYDSL
jgi:hypothetical protein